mgnify:CR=1 FL=1
MVDGLLLEEDFTSGGAADIPAAFQEQISNIDYKTLRYPGHWEWIDTLLKNVPEDQDAIAFLEAEIDGKMNDFGPPNGPQIPPKSVRKQP